MPDDELSTCNHKGVFPKHAPHKRWGYCIYCGVPVPWPKWVVDEEEWGDTSDKDLS